MDMSNHNKTMLLAKSPTCVTLDSTDPEQELVRQDKVDREFREEEEEAEARTRGGIGWQNLSWTGPQEPW